MKNSVRIYNENNNTLWQDAIALEMKNVRIAFQLYNRNPKNLKGYKPVGTHLIFDIKLGENVFAKPDVSGTDSKL